MADLTTTDLLREGLREVNPVGSAIFLPDNSISCLLRT
jgi:hypothetical protein